MKASLAAVAALLWATGTGFGHRLDEYLQGTLLSVEKNRVTAEMTLTPGTAVLPLLLAEIDTNADGVLSGAEQRGYATRVMREISMTIDGVPLRPSLTAVRFPSIEEMHDGRGEIHIEFAADLPSGGTQRSLVLENRHESRMAAYQVNCLVPRDPGIRVIAQKRNYSQSFYELDYVQTGAGWSAAAMGRSPGGFGWLSALAIVLGARFLWLWRQRAPAVDAGR